MEKTASHKANVSNISSPSFLMSQVITPGNKLKGKQPSVWEELQWASHFIVSLRCYDSAHLNSLSGLTCDVSSTDLFIGYVIPLLCQKTGSIWLHVICRLFKTGQMKAGWVQGSVHFRTVQTISTGHTCAYVNEILQSRRVIVLDRGITVESITQDTHSYKYKTFCVFIRLWN